MIVQWLVLRVKKSVLPSGENVGEPSPPGPEITPGAKISGVGRGVDGVAATFCAGKRIADWASAPENNVAKQTRIQRLFDMTKTLPFQSVPKSAMAQHKRLAKGVKGLSSHIRNRGTCYIPSGPRARKAVESRIGDKNLVGSQTKKSASA
jgi:hypothetical protein